ncbi:hypothetical protein JRO89_XS03G0313600 [Xanthoceras sorbifolium]|uniref:Hexosyltransferase n=1 Tax=Xanthoceras sorbifolium TaxID=99658 RepID=A0ABQ8ID27_9ROSI|nr:hypothetical protein JRO89_XS03G0313600 [Xanthoceras sorbifolium]
MASSNSKPSSNFKQKLFIVSLLLLSVSLLAIVFCFTPKPHPPTQLPLIRIQNKPKWFDLFDLFENEINGGGGGKNKIKVGLVNVVDDDDDLIRESVPSSFETVRVRFNKVSENLRWEDFFPEWIDEDHKWGPPTCPEIPMPPRTERYEDLDVIVARVPCQASAFRLSGGGSGNNRDLFRLQVNLVVANLAVESGWVKPDVDRTVYVVFIGTCRPMVEIFRCDDLVQHVGDYWVYKPELKRLKQKVLMPVGSCQIAPAFAQTGEFQFQFTFHISILSKFPLFITCKELWRYYMSQSTLKKVNYTTYHQREAYVTILHSSEAYVCGAIALAQSIIQNNSTRDLVLLYDKSISSKSLRGLRAAGWKTKWISRIRSPFAKKGAYNEWNYSKLRVWQLIEYDKVIFIDADLLILENIDRFFVFPELSAAANDKTLFNSGLMVVEPSDCKFEDMMLKSFKIASYNGGDQGFLNEIFTWWHRLPKKLNTLKVFNKPGDDKHELPDGVYAIHYLGLKPWMCYKDYDCNWDMESRHIFASDSAHKPWWKVYDAMPLRLQQYCVLTEKMDKRIKKWRGIARNAKLSNGHWKIPVRDPRQYNVVKQ